MGIKEKMEILVEERKLLYPNIGIGSGAAGLSHLKRRLILD
jgi:hypothetical protein